MYLQIEDMIGLWKSEGWDVIICEQADFVPYIPVVLQEFELPDVRERFENVEYLTIGSRKEVKAIYDQLMKLPKLKYGMLIEHPELYQS